jgi:divalent metal cation (Fe/Co/Zn/Cd) transporter
MRITTGLATGNAAADDWAALCASPIILFNGIQQLRPPIRALLDTAPSTNLEEEVRWVSRTVPGVEGVEKCFIRKMGFKFYVDLHVLVDGRISVTDGHAIAHAVQGALLTSQPKIAKVLVHVEPAPKRDLRASERPL